MSDREQNREDRGARRPQRATREEQGDLLADAVTGLFALEQQATPPGDQSEIVEAERAEGVDALVEEKAPVDSTSGMQAQGSLRLGEDAEGTQAPSVPAPEKEADTIPDSPWERRMAWAKERVREGRLEDAKELYLELVEEDPDNVRALNNLGVLLDEMGDPEGAVRRLRSARRLDPRNMEVLGNLGAALAALGLYSEAETELRHASRLDPTNLEIRANVGILLFRRGLYEQAAAELESVCAGRPDDGLPFYYRGEALNRLGRVDEAIEALERVTELLPNNPKAYYTLGVLLDKKNQPDRAAIMYRRARKLTSP